MNTPRETGLTTRIARSSLRLTLTVVVLALLVGGVFVFRACSQ